METQIKDFNFNNIVDELVKQKNIEYYFMQKTEREIYYDDDKNNILIYNIKQEKDIIYLLELQEIKKESELYCFIVYKIQIGVPLKNLFTLSDSEGVEKNKVHAADIFNKFRDSINLQSELEKYVNERL